MLEIQKFENYTDGTYIKLNDYAQEDTIKCRIANIGDEIIPSKFRYDGSPCFPYETYLKYSNGNHYARVYVEVEYKSKELELSEQVFNTAQGINNYITDLETLRHIMNIRSIAYNKKKIKLNEFVWRGILCFDQFGQTIYLYDHRSLNPNVKDITIEKCLFHKYCEGWTETFRQIPEQNEMCPVCGKVWTLDTIPDYIVERKDYQLIGYHKECLRKYNDQIQLQEFKNIFAKVYNINELTFKSIPNEYCSCERCASWFVVSTPDGHIKIGWRKRVINIAWLGDYRLYSEMFESEGNITRGFGECGSLINERYIHAWSIEKAIEYLNRAKNSIIK